MSSALRLSVPGVDSSVPVPDREHQVLRRSAGVRSEVRLGELDGLHCGTFIGAERLQGP